MYFITQRHVDDGPLAIAFIIVVSFQVRTLKNVSFSDNVFCLLETRIYCQQDLVRFQLTEGVDIASSPFFEERQTVNGVQSKTFCSTLCLRTTQEGQCCNAFQFTSGYQCIMYTALYHKEVTSGSENIYSTNLRRIISKTSTVSVMVMSYF